jgi:hypothetical protein
MGFGMAKTVVPPRRRLSDLYVVGKSVVFEDPAGDVEIYLRRPNPFEHEEALREGNLARARMALRMKDPSTDEYAILHGELAAVGDRIQKAEILFNENYADYYQRAFTWVQEQDRWSKDDYATSVTDALADYEEREVRPVEGDEDWEDYQRVVKEVEEFTKDVDTRLEKVKKDEIDEFLMLEELELDERIMRVLIDRQAGVAFYRGYRVACLYYATRDPDDHGKRYFSNKQELMELPAEVQSRLLEEYDALDVPRDEVKNSPSAEASSELSAPSTSPEITEPSGPTESTE